MLGESRSQEFTSPFIISCLVLSGASVLSSLICDYSVSALELHLQGLERTKWPVVSAIEVKVLRGPHC